MTKKDIVTKIADETDIKQIHVKKVVQRALDIIIESLEKDAGLSEYILYTRNKIVSETTDTKKRMEKALEY